jgi:hypothetical protein
MLRYSQGLLVKPCWAACLLNDGDAFAVIPGCMAAVALIAVVGERLHMVSAGLTWI